MTLLQMEKLRIGGPVLGPLSHWQKSDVLTKSFFWQNGHPVDLTIVDIEVWAVFIQKKKKIITIQHLTVEPPSYWGLFTEAPVIWTMCQVVGILVGFLLTKLKYKIALWHLTINPPPLPRVVWPNSWGPLLTSFFVKKLILSLQHRSMLGGWIHFQQKSENF